MLQPLDTGGQRMERDAPEDLLLRAGAGELRAFELLYDRTAMLVHAVARDVLGDEQQAEEVTQEALVEVWRTAARYRPERGDAVAWLLTVAHRRAVDRLRSVRSARERETRFAARSHEIAHDSVVEAVLTRGEYRQVRRCLSTLTALQLEAVTLTYYCGLTYREAAQRLAAPASTVKTRLRDGLIRLRDCLHAQR
ncbi:sigma-70 family RNA polymerase sigma factor [Saccharopolyspora gloriosae]|uniref:sigma-70 family RNA polymerase sigma factor n=1 Tax=Saccharopolyspora gloriosae TaxID=455344 RepID=UPI001FB7B1D0|nr:sigma-70 family RNA polymerase sigma factor [Saccharopolyspora gloriosae]